MKHGGFTLLEVLVAITILALSMTAIFATEGGAIKMAHKSRKMGIASLLARCKMGEIEEQIAMEGLPAQFDTGSDECCEDAEVEGFSCRWEIVPIVMPETMYMGDDGSLDDFAASAATTTETPSSEGTEEAESDTAADFLSGGGDVDGLAAMAMTFVYPALKDAFEQQVRRCTVSVHWNEGSSDHSFDVTQYLVSNDAVQVSGEELQEGAAEAGGGTAPTGEEP